MGNIPTGNRLSEIERSFFSQRVTGATPVHKTDQLKRQYWGSLGLVGSYGDMEKNWLKKIIIDNSGTPSATIYVSTILSEVLSVLGLAPSKSTDENWMKLFKNYNP